MDPQAITLMLGGLGTAVGAILIGLAQYRKESAPHSAVLGTFKMLWNWLDWTKPDEALIEKMRTGGSITAAIPPRLRRAVLRIVDPDALKQENRQTDRQEQPGEDREIDE